MNRLVHCYALAVLLDDPSKGDDARNAVMPTSLDDVTDPGPLLQLVLMLQLELNGDTDAKSHIHALRGLACIVMPLDFAKEFIRESELWEIQRELRLFRLLADHYGGLKTVFILYLQFLVGRPASPKPMPPSPSGNATRKNKRKRRGQPPRRARA